MDHDGHHETPTLPSLSLRASLESTKETTLTQPPGSPETALTTTPHRSPAARSDVLLDSAEKGGTSAKKGEGHLVHLDHRAPDEEGPDGGVETSHVVHRRSSSASVNTGGKPADHADVEADNLLLEKSHGGQRFRLTVCWLYFVLILGVSVGVTNVLFHKLYANLEDFWVNSVIASVAADDSVAMHLLRAAGVLTSSVLVAYVVAYRAPECSGGGHIAVKACVHFGVPVPGRVGIYRFLISAIYLGFGNPTDCE